MKATALRPAAFATARHAGFETFLSYADLIQGIRPVSPLAIISGVQ